MSFSFKKQLVAAGIALTVLSAQAAASELKPAQQAQLAPMTQVSLPNVKGGLASLADFKGKVVLVDFWASWCGPCRQSFPWMNQLQNQYKSDGLEVVAINLDQEADLAAEFLQEVPAQFTVLLDTDAQLPGEYGVMGMPSSYLIDRNGKIRAQHIGFHSDRVKDYEDTIKALLAE
ncbi:TlpA family protein disulfide reductase [Oceanospirillum sanctuarii]|uniref:TlpA family protein disulfide reductase n=1 Tax=Oceanospirillum sanctuarii TaxID=1434821 RepID=UPI000A3BF765|nr:TlpA disulfide reductase family protein [Oceanospirillum sanctuarii]